MKWPTKIYPLQDAIENTYDQIIIHSKRLWDRSTHLCQHPRVRPTRIGQRFSSSLPDLTNQCYIINMNTTTTSIKRWHKIFVVVGSNQWRLFVDVFVCVVCVCFGYVHRSYAEAECGLLMFVSSWCSILSQKKFTLCKKNITSSYVF